MNISFYTAHMDTLCDLKQMAEKHNCRINFGFDTSSSEEMDEDILIECGFKEELLGNLDSCSIEGTCSGWSKVWFELYDKNNNSYHTLAYLNSYCRFELELFDRYDCDEEFLEMLESHYDIDECGHDRFYCNFSDAPTIIHGFNNEGEVRDYRVYRSGMALSYFSDLVCEYLGEEKISRTY